MSRGAFSLVETLIAMLILAVALVGLAVVPIATTRLMVHGAERERATSVAMTRLEEVEGVRLDSSSIPAWVVVTSDDRGYLWNRTVHSSASSDLWTVTVEVEWSGLMGSGSLSVSRDYGPFSVRGGSL
ncbi:hypothetical protein L2W58_01005 [Dethiosulfovibrio sp. F2B]|uniref:type IV pilus modification PilV family protein n=1 Tax=Dethiosulfovibrio faecalis TaxID=2720018 RepID=UPI001F176816|nr:hypothetical protein [Dethiosulfovibrio faecalis]MCF4150384.1 hypothetical protein [Dethiosulfovibrio faecalis]